MATETIRLIGPTPRLSADFCALAAEFVAEGDLRYQQAAADCEPKVEPFYANGDEISLVRQRGFGVPSQYKTHDWTHVT